jgi:hypothetical protein
LWKNPEQVKKILLSLMIVLIQLGAINFAFGQTTPANEYKKLIHKADSLHKTKNDSLSAFTYTSAFNKYGWMGIINTHDRYGAACSWALAGYTDSAFYYLDRIATKGNFSDFGHISLDFDLISLQNDVRWLPLLDLIKQNMDKAYPGLNKSLAYQLDSILIDDQKYRLMISDITDKYGDKSKELKELWKKIDSNDSINLIKVKAILDKYGWLGTDVVGSEGNSALFLVIQHADLETQEKYLPMMKEAVQNGKAKASSLALLIDRIEMENGRPQIYGSQVNIKNGKGTVYKILDEANVNKRRAEVGLGPLEEYLKHFNIDYILPEK